MVDAASVKLRRFHEVVVISSDTLTSGRLNRYRQQRITVVKVVCNFETNVKEFVA